MTDQAAQPVVDPAGIPRSLEGQIQEPGQTEQVTETTPSTNDGNTLLTAKDPVVEPVVEDKDKPAAKAPEKYEDYKLPEGFKLDDKVRGEADALFKGLGLTQEGAQSLVDFYSGQMTKTAQAPYEAYKALTDSWRTDAESHPDLRGKLGPGQEVNVRISKALDSLGDTKLVSDFKQLMDLTGAGNNQAFIRVIDKFAQKVTEGTHVAGNGPSKGGQSDPSRPAQPTAAAAMWPNLSQRS